MLFQAVPPGFVPVQDKQYLVSFAQLPRRRQRWTGPSAVIRHAWADIVG